MPVARTSRGPFPERPRGYAPAVMRAGSGISEASDGVRAACEAALAQAGADRADAALLLATADHGPGAPELLDAAADVLGVAPAGGTAHGVLAAGGAVEDAPGVAVLAFAGGGAEPFLLDGLAGAESKAGPELLHRLSRLPRAEDLVVLLPDPYAVAPEPLVRSLAESLGPALLVGGGTVDGPAAPPLQWAESEVATGAVAEIVLPGAAPPRAGVTQACRPASGPLRVGRTDGHWLLELDGRPALEVFREVARGPLAEDLRRAAAFVFLALPDPGDPGASLAAGDYRVRNVAGFSEPRGALAVPEPVRTGAHVAFVLREPHGARDDLKRMLGAVASGPRAAAGLYLDCCARGRSLFGVPELEAAYLAEALGPVPVAGWLGAYEIGPVRGRSEVLTYTAVLALVDGGGGGGQSLG